MVNVLANYCVSNDFAVCKGIKSTYVYLKLIQCLSVIS